jgi:hypothetical protein
MSDVASSRALRVGAACILGVLGLLAARAHFASADAAQPGVTVVLNNRGYNYGPPPAPRIDAQLFAGEQAGAGQR